MAISDIYHPFKTGISIVEKRQPWLMHRSRSLGKTRSCRALRSSTRSLKVEETNMRKVRDDWGIVGHPFFRLIFGLFLLPRLGYRPPVGVYDKWIELNLLAAVWARHFFAKGGFRHFRPGSAMRAAKSY